MRKPLKLSSVLVAILTTITMAACGNTAVNIDYADAASFEAALNNGDNLEGKIVSFVAEELHPDSTLGYNVYAGEHLNFVSSRNPDIKEGDIVTVKVTEITNLMGSWVIKYEIISSKAGEIAVADEITDSAEDNVDTVFETSAKEEQTPPGADGLSASLDIGNSETKDEVTMIQEEEQKPLEIIDYGWCGTPDEYSDSVYIDYCAKVHNPNTGFAALFPEVLVTVRNAEGHILATDSHMGGKIMPEDSVILASTFSILKEDITDDAQINFDVQWREMTGSDMDKYPKTSDFEIINVSERAAKHDSRVTGEIVNNFGSDVDMVKLTLLFKKDGKIVGIENTFLDNLKSGKATPFEFSFWSEIPEHDDMEISAQDW